MVVFLVSKVGMKNAINVATFLVQWGTVARRMHREPTITDYMVYWKCSEATYYRQLRQFRKVWPDDKSPHRRWSWIDANVRLPVKMTDSEKVVARLLAGPVPG